MDFLAVPELVKKAGDIALDDKLFCGTAKGA